MVVGWLARQARIVLSVMRLGLSQSARTIARARSFNLGRAFAETDTCVADKFMADARALADLKIEKAAVESERRTVEADLGPVRYLAALRCQADEAVPRYQKSTADH
jgi:hypothetical protein